MSAQTNSADLEAMADDMLAYATEFHGAYRRPGPSVDADTAPRRPTAWQRMATTLRARHPGMRVYLVDVFDSNLEPLARNRLLLTRACLRYVAATQFRAFFGRAPHELHHLPGFMGEAVDHQRRCVAVTQLNDR